MAAGMSGQLRSIFSTIDRELAALREVPSSASFNPDLLAQQTALGSELVADLVRLAQCPTYESMQHVNLADAVRATMAELESRATRRGVTLKSHIPVHVDLESRPAAAGLLARTLINDAILATPRGSQVTVTVEPLAKGARILVEDGGSRIPDEAYGALVSTRLDPSTVGRPSTMALFCAHLLAQHLGTEIELVRATDEAPGGARLQVKLAT